MGREAIAAANAGKNSLLNSVPPARYLALASVRKTCCLQRKLSSLLLEVMQTRYLPVIVGESRSITAVT